jgi:ABC-type nitrate/sulfonate/bicarbonate transport system substrate-binding protein
MTRRQALAGLGGTALALAAAPMGRTHAATPDRFRITYPARAFITLPFWVAHEAGIFARHGLASDLVFGAHPAGIASVIGGETHMTPYSPEQLISAHLRAPTLSISSMPVQRAPFIMMGVPGVKTPADLKGKRIGIPRVGDVYYFNSLLVLAKAGLGERDVAWIPTGGVDASVRAQMMRRGQMDAAFMSVQYTLALQDDGFPKIIDLGDDSGFFSPVVTGHKRSFVEANPDVIRRFLMAQGEATRLIYADPDRALAIYRKYDEQPIETLRRVYELYVKSDNFERVPLIVRPPIAYSVGRVAAEIPEVKSADLSVLFGNGPVKTLIQEGFYTSLFGDSVKTEQDAKLAIAV